MRIKSETLILIVFLFVMTAAKYIYDTSQVRVLKVSAETMGQSWPFTFDSGTLSCQKPELLTIQDNGSGEIYALNYHTMLMEPEKWRSVDDVLDEAVFEAGSFKSVRPVIDRALSLCTCSWLDYRPACGNNSLLSR